MTYLERIRFYSTVAIFGCLWGAIEVFIGSYLHLLNIPLRGAFMAGMASVILAGGRAFANFKMSSLSVAIIAASLKMVGFGVFKLGPVAGILIEGIMAEIIFSFLGLKKMSVFLSSVLLSIEGLPHFIITSWIMYGGTIFEAYLKVLSKVSNIFHLPQNFYFTVFFLWLAAHIIIGSFFGRISIIVLGKVKNEF